MIKIIKDISKEYQTTNKFIEVTNLTNYFEARRFFFENYKQKIDFEIIIKNKKYFSYFLDFENYENVEIEIINEVESSKEKFDYSQTIFKVLLNYLKKLKISSKEIDSLKNDYLQEYKFLSSKKYQNIDEIIQVLVKVIVFSKYRECNFNILLDDEFTEEMYSLVKENIRLKESYNKEKKNLTKYIEKCNDILIKQNKKIQLFNDIPTEKYLCEINGELDFEEHYFIEKTVERLNQLKDYEDIRKNILKAEHTFNKKYDDIIKLIDILVLLEKDKKNKKENLDDFKEFFLEIYLNYNSISSQKNLEIFVEEIERRYEVNLLSLKKSIKNIWAESNKFFEEFYLNNYSNLYSSFEKKGLDYAIENSFSLLNNNKKNIYIFIDCLRYDIWLGIKKYMQNKGWNCHLDRIVLSAIPTVTSYCKKILYTGKKFNQIENNDKFKVDVENILNIQDIKESESKNLLYEILDLDMLFHGIKDLNEESIQVLIQIKLNNILREIDPNKYNIIIMTDHGALKLYEEGFSSFSEYKNILVSKNLEIENHGRYIKVYSKSFNSELYEELNDYLKKATKEFYIINREEMSKYYLPLADNSIENYFYFIYKYGKYPKKTSEYNHGGISYEEVFVPYGIFKSEIKEFKPISLELKTLELKNSIRSEIIILIKNDNILQNLKIKLKYQEFEKEYKELEGNKLIQIPLKLEESFEGEYVDIVEVTYNFEGKEESFKSTINLNIIKNQKLMINKKLKQSRALL